MPDANSYEGKINRQIEQGDVLIARPDINKRKSLVEPKRSYVVINPNPEEGKNMFTVARLTNFGATTEEVTLHKSTQAWKGFIRHEDRTDIR